jgi:hypothetical protein
LLKQNSPLPAAQDCRKDVPDPLPSCPNLNSPVTTFSGQFVVGNTYVLPPGVYRPTLIGGPRPSTTKIDAGEMICIRVSRGRVVA